MFKRIVYNAVDKPGNKEKSDIINFLYEHLEEYRDPKKDITNAVNYA